jgi:peptidyl-prolyl cis-trans isomerase B (cyclophilin B)
MKNILFGFIILTLASCAKPIANFVYTGNDNPAPANIKFENKSEKAEAYEWDFGDGNFSSDENPSHEYSASGNYLVTLKAKKGKKETVKEERVFIEAPIQCLVEIETNYGTMVVHLYDDTPKHRDNFVKLAEEGFYDDLLFHRVINGFMIQGGDPKSRGADAKTRLGSGGPGYQIPAEFVDTLAHVKGALAAARTNNPEKKSSGSQFYIVDGKPVKEQQIAMMESQKGIRYTPEQREIYAKQGGTPFLDQEYTVFGQVIEGLDVIDKIAEVKTAPGDRPKEDVWMKIRVIK